MKTANTFCSSKILSFGIKSQTFKKVAVLFIKLHSKHISPKENPSTLPT